MYRVHNSTVSRQLRYALTKERLCCMAVTPATYAPYAVAEMGGRMYALPRYVGLVSGMLWEDTI